MHDMAWQSGRGRIRDLDPSGCELTCIYTTWLVPVNLLTTASRHVDQGPCMGKPILVDRRRSDGAGHHGFVHALDRIGEAASEREAPGPALGGEQRGGQRLGERVDRLRQRVPPLVACGR